MDYYFVSTIYTAFIRSKCCHDVTGIERHIRLRNNNENFNFEIFSRYKLHLVDTHYCNTYTLILEKNFRISKREKKCNCYAKIISFNR